MLFKVGSRCVGALGDSVALLEGEKGSFKS